MLFIHETDNYTDYEAYGTAGFVKVVFQEESGGYLVIHPEHGQNEWEENKRLIEMTREEVRNRVFVRKFY